MKTSYFRHYSYNLIGFILRFTKNLQVYIYERVWPKNYLEHFLNIRKI